MRRGLFNRGPYYDSVIKIAPIIVMIFFLTAVPSALAATFRVKSKIADINTATNYLKLYLLNTQTDTIEEIKVEVDASTQFQGFNSLRDLTQGDEVSAEVNYNEFHSEYQALQIGLLTKRESGLLTTPLPAFHPPLISSGSPLFQNAIEEKPIQDASKK